MKDIIKFTNNRNQFPSIWDLVSQFDEINPLDAILDRVFIQQFPSVSKELGVMKPFGSQSYPKLNIEETDKSFIVTAELAGLSQKDVSVEIDDEKNILTISGNKTEKEENQENKKYILRELKHSSFSRSISIGNNVDKQSTQAEFKDGILKVILQKKEKEEPKNTKIKIL